MWFFENVIIVLKHRVRREPKHVHCRSSDKDDLQTCAAPTSLLHLCQIVARYCLQ